MLMLMLMLMFVLYQVCKVWSLMYPLVSTFGVAYVGVSVAVDVDAALFW